MTCQSDPEEHEVIIVGGGFSGLGVAIQLLQRGMRSFAVLEKAGQLGGTWRDNTYPGCACDVPSQLYSFSYAPSNTWSRVFAEQPEIQSYLLRVAKEHGVTPHVRTNTEVLAMHWDADAHRWELQTSSGPMRARALVLGAGPLHEPVTPNIEGLASFEGTHFHSARWRHDYDLTGRRVAVVGTGSSAIQLVPKIQPEVESLVLFQRTAPWVLPKPDHAYPAIEQAAFARLPGFRRAYRSAIYGALELLQLAQRSTAAMRQVQRVGTLHLRRQVRDPELRRVLTPSFVLGCKRLLLSNTYYPALQRPNVTVVNGGLSRIEGNTVTGADSRSHEVDTIIFGTGFRVTDPPIAERVFGRHGKSLAQVWDGSPRAYLGTTVHGFPNMFFMIGPNLANGHSSAFVLIEAQAEYIAGALETMRARGLTSVEVRQRPQDRYNEEVQAALASTVWNAGGCASYYIDRNGINSTIYPWSTIDLRRRLRRFDASVYTLHGPPKLEPRTPTRPTAIDLRGSVVAVTGGARGIGCAIAKQLADRGAIVCIGDLDLPAAEQIAAELGGHALPLDVASRPSFASFIEAVEAEVGPIDVLVNNAGVMPTGALLSESDAVDTAAMSINHFGTSLGMKLVLPRMIGRGRGHVINVASMAGRVHVPGLATYVASKHATVGLSRAVREEIAGSGVTVTTILPGAVNTRLSDGIPMAGLGRLEPEDVAAAAVESCRTRKPEIAVPRWLGAVPLAETLLPASFMRAFRRLVRSDRVLTSADPRVRGRYEAEIREQGRRLATARATTVTAP